MENLIKPEFGLTFWTILIFVILVMLLAKFVWKPLLAAVDEREKRIAADVEKAAKSREEAENMKLEIEQRLKSLNKEISERINRAIYEANIEREKIIEKARTQAELLVENAKKEMESQKMAIEKEIEKKLVETSSLIAKKVLGEIVDKKIDEKILEISLKEYKSGSFRKN
ncbi:MAG: F0F1 ATP synthase subunit B [Elusimicrobiota bacterium]